MRASERGTVALTIAVSMCLGGCTAVAEGPRPRQTDLVALINSSASSAEYFEAQFCGGVVLAADVVVTAAHCVSERDASTFDVVWGVDDLCEGSSGSRVQVAAIMLDDSLPRDIAVLELREPLPGYSQVRSAAVEVPFPIPKVREGALVLATGWGRLSSRGVAPCQVRAVELTVIDVERCVSVLDGVTDPTDVMCTLPRSSLNTCEGDSGGPLAVIVGRRQVTVAVTASGEGRGPTDVGVNIRLDRDEVLRVLGRSPGLPG